MLAEQKRLFVLLVDDSQDDRFFIRRLLSRHPNLSVCGEAEDGEDAISYLQGEAHYSNRSEYPFPDLLILDLKMPRKTGYEVLEWIKNSRFSDLPIFVLSGSSLDADRVRCLELGAKAYCSKTVNLRDQGHVIRVIEKWINEE